MCGGLGGCRYRVRVQVSAVADRHGCSDSRYVCNVNSITQCPSTIPAVSASALSDMQRAAESMREAVAKHDPRLRAEARVDATTAMAAALAGAAAAGGGAEGAEGEARVRGGNWAVGW